MPSPCAPEPDRCPTLTVLIPSYNEKATLGACVDRVLELASDGLSLEIIIVDDCAAPPRPA